MRRTLSALLFCAIVVFAFGSRALAAPKLVTSVEGITEYRLDNGMRLLLFPDPSKPMLTVNLTVLVGSRNEGYGEAGMAHLLEHMLFKQTENFHDIKKLLTEKGARWNGSTWLDRTNYFETIPASDENLDFFIHFESERLVRCPIKAEDLASEMTVVRNEFEIGENNPGAVLFKHMQAVAFDWHNYGKSTIGNRSDIERVPADSLRVFYKKYYQPDNAILIVAGRFDPAKALASFDKYFGAIPRPQRVLDEPYTQEPAQDGERSVTLRRVGDVGIVAMMFHVPAGPDEQFPAVYALADVLGNTPSGRLYEALVKTHKAVSVDAGAEANYDPNVMEVEARVREGQSMDEVRQIMIQTMQEVADKGVTPEEIKRVQTRFASERIRASADTARVAINLSEWAAQGDWRLYFLMRDRVEKLTAQQVQEAARNYLRESNRTVGIFIPSKAPDRTTVPPRPDVVAMLNGYKGRAAIAAGEQLDPDPLKLEQRIQRSELPSGIKVALLPKKSRQQMVSVRLTLRYGNEQSLAGKRQAAQVLPELMMRGTDKLNFAQLQDTLDSYHATLNASGDAGVISLSLQVERPHLREALELLKQVLREPALSNEEFQTIRREALANEEQSRSDPQALAITALNQKLNPFKAPDPRYDPTIAEDIQQLQALTVEQVRQLYQTQLGASAGELAAVGDFDPQELLDGVKSAIDGWKSGVEYRRLEHKTIDNPSHVEQVIETPDKANAIFIAGLPLALKDSDADYPALFMASDVLGGSAQSRLWMRLREKEGFSYGTGCRASADALDPAGRLLIYAAFNPVNKDKLHKAADEELQRFLADGPTAQELNQAREAYLRQGEMGRTEDGRLVGLLASQLHAGRTMQFEADLIAKLKALSPADLQAAARKYIHPDQLAVFLAGDFAKKAK